MEKSIGWRSEMHLAKADLAKAHDRVMLQSVCMALGRGGGPPSLVKAHLKCALEREALFSALGRVTTDRVHLKKGLSQGCPASPVLFTVVQEDVPRDLTRRWEEQNMGLHMDGVRIDLLAFADDTYILADTAWTIATMLGDLWSTLRRASMALQPSKCQRLPLQSSSDVEGLCQGAHRVARCPDARPRDVDLGARCGRGGHSPQAPEGVEDTVGKL